MKKRSSARAVLVGLAVLGLALVFVQRRSGDPGDAEEARGGDPALLVDRMWVDSKPEKYTDYTHAFLVLGGAPIGIFQKASAYQATLEIFEYKRQGGGLSLLFPQSGTKKQTKFRVRECSDLPPFDLCLELAQNPWGGPRRYYGLSDPGEEERHLGALRHELEHRAPGAAARE